METVLSGSGDRGAKDELSSSGDMSEALSLGSSIQLAVMLTNTCPTRISQLILQPCIIALNSNAHAYDCNIFEADIWKIKRVRTTRAVGIEKPHSWGPLACRPSFDGQSDRSCRTVMFLHREVFNLSLYIELITICRCVHIFSYKLVRRPC
jgi:hypothetical protein